MLIDVALGKDLDEGLGDDRPPVVLWHYTGASAAKAILETSRLHLGCHAFMNDPAEGAVAGSMVCECWAAALDASPDHPRLSAAHLRDAKESLSYFDFNRPELPPTFLFSLTELRDSLSQWSRYGDNGAGVALGFAVRPDELPPRSNKPWTTGTKLVQVHYDEPGEERAPNKVRKLLGRLFTDYWPKFQDPTSVENTLLDVVHRLNPLVKAGAYSEEREWRIITRTVLDSDQLYEMGCNRFGIAPYVPLPFGRGVALVELMLGPKLSPDNVWSAKWLCRKFGHAPTISRSALAYR